ncbi:MAG TPA: hypothetical protein VFN16_06195 [Saccharospirillum sp.]|nr:hypothetical protein [Saccharospirillum sp.]
MLITLSFLVDDLMPNVFTRLKNRIIGLADRPYYPGIVALVAASDYFIPGSPTNAIFISSILPRPAQWLKLSLYFSFGCASGAFVLATLMGIYGEAFVAWVVQSEAGDLWQRFDEMIARYGVLVLAALAVSSAPVRTVVAILALAGTLPIVIAGIVLAGRLVAYPGLAWLVSRCPGFVVRIPFIGPRLSRAK